MAKIFVVEDNSSLSEAIVSYLEVEGHSVVLFERMTGVLACPELPDIFF